MTLAEKGGIAVILICLFKMLEQAILGNPLPAWMPLLLVVGYSGFVYGGKYDKERDRISGLSTSLVIIIIFLADYVVKQVSTWGHVIYALLIPLLIAHIYFYNKYRSA